MKKLQDAPESLKDTNNRVMGATGRNAPNEYEYVAQEKTDVNLGLSSGDDSDDSGGDDFEQYN